MACIFFGFEKIELAYHSFFAFYEIRNWFDFALSALAEYILLQGWDPCGDGDGKKVSTASVDGDGDEESLSPRGRGWGANPRWGIPRCHL